MQELVNLEKITRMRFQDLMREAEMERLARQARGPETSRLSILASMGNWLRLTVADWRRASADWVAMTGTSPRTRPEARIRRTADLVLSTGENRPIVLKTGTFPYAKSPCGE